MKKVFKCLDLWELFEYVLKVQKLKQMVSKLNSKAGDCPHHSLIKFVYYEIFQLLLANNL